MSGKKGILGSKVSRVSHSLGCLGKSETLEEFQCLRFRNEVAEVEAECGPMSPPNVPPSTLQSGRQQLGTDWAPLALPELIACPFQGLQLC